MKSIVLYPVLLVIVFVNVCISCSDHEGDTEKPVINLEAPEEGEILKIGSDVHFDMELSDNEMLRSYKVEIHNNFDNHGHDSKATRAEGETVPFLFNKSWDISGSKNVHVHHHEIVIPENTTEGAYHFMVYCTDEAGNESYVVRNIELSHDGEEHDHHH
ncbi:MAG: DUF4625 domain-containing protein [Tannerellaceae bacterium]|jgi:hypothetical protein|nr:DUF4625 domain-containing protein [Tannerellaceae bacterium]